MDELRSGYRTGAAARRNDWSGPPSGAPSGRSAAPSAAWMVTFSDLTLLLLTFFVLLFSMSTLRTEAWTSFVDGISTRFDVLVERPTTRTSPEAATEAVIVPPGDDLRYLRAVFAEAAAGEPVLRAVEVLPGGDRLVLALPADAFAVAGPSLEATPSGLRLLEELAPLLARLDNRVQVAVRAADADRALRSGVVGSTWAGALSDAEVVAATVRGAGYGRSIDVFAHMAASVAVAGSAAPRLPQAGPVTILVLPEGRE